MSAPVDVLAVLDAMTLSAERLAAGESVTSCAATVEVAKCTRDAVADLLAKAIDKVTDGCPCDSCEALRVAIRNCGGEA